MRSTGFRLLLLWSLCWVPQTLFAGHDWPSDTTIYLRGSFNDWGLAHPMEFIEEAEEYRVSLRLEEGTYGFKIASENWETVDLGAPMTGGASDLLIIDFEYQLASIGNNIPVSVSGADTYTFVVYVDDPDSFFVAVYDSSSVPEPGVRPNQGTAVPSPTDNIPFDDSVYLRGPWNDFGFENPMQYIETADEYRLSLRFEAGIHEFTISTEDEFSIAFGPLESVSTLLSINFEYEVASRRFAWIPFIASEEDTYTFVLYVGDTENFSVAVYDSASLPEPGVRPNLGVEPPSPRVSIPFEDPIYLRGSFNDWGLEYAMEFAEEESVYRVTVPLDSGTYEFRIGSADWITVDLGPLVGEVRGIELGAQLRVGVRDERPIFLEITEPDNFQFELDVSDGDDLLLRVLPLGDTAPPIVIPFDVPIFLRGSFNAWGLDNPMAYDEATMSYTVDVPLNAGDYEFKIASEDWETVDLGNFSDPPVPIALDVPLGPLTPPLGIFGAALNIQFAAPVDDQYRFLLDGSDAEDLTVKVSALGTEADVFDLREIDGGTASGTDEDDTFYVDDESDSIVSGGDGIDRVVSFVSYTAGDAIEYVTLAGSDPIDATGNGLDNLLTGNQGDNELSGEQGRDTLRGGIGDDFINGGDGLDIALYAGLSADFEIVSTEDGFTVTDLFPSDGDQGTDSVVNVEIFRFDDKDVLLIELTVEGTAEAETIDLSVEIGGAAFGGGGDDVFVIDDNQDIVIEDPQEGVDRVEASVSYTLGRNVEDLTLTGTEAINARGNELDNLIIGNDADNELDGGPGADELRGGAGADTYRVDNLEDVVVEPSTSEALAGSGTTARGREGRDGVLEATDVADDIDTVIATVSFALSDFVENLTLDGVRDIDATGNALDNVIVGNSGDNVLTSGEGDLDDLRGSLGDDTYRVTKREGATVIRDLPGENNRVDLIVFLGEDMLDELDFEETSDGALTIRNSEGGRVEITRFFDSLGATVSELDFGDEVLDVSGVTRAEDFEVVITNGVCAEISDTDENLWDSTIELCDGQQISATEAQLFRAYSGAFGRLPDQAGYEWWMGEILAGRHTLSSMLTGFLFSEEFLGFVDSEDGNAIDNTVFLNHVYRNVFGREPDEAGIAFWLGELESGSRSQARVLEEMTQSNEFVELQLKHVVAFLSPG